MIDAVRKAGGEFYAITSEPQSLARNAQADWETGLEHVGDPLPQIAEQYIYPAVDIFKSGTRREELLLPPHQWEKISLIRRGLAGHRPVEAMERLLSIMERFPSNAQMLLDIKPMH